MIKIDYLKAVSKYFQIFFLVIVINSLLLGLDNASASFNLISHNTVKRNLYQEDKNTTGAAGRAYQDIFNRAVRHPVWQGEVDRASGGASSG